MENQERNSKEYYTIDMLHIVKSLWKRVWIIALAGLLCAAIGFAIPTFLIEETYSSSVMLYVNNTSVPSGYFNISSSEIMAAQSLVNTYGEILNNRTTLEQVIEKAEVPYTYKQLSAMIVSEPANETEIMKITVTTENPYEAAKIANCIAEILPMRIAQIIDGATMNVVEYAEPNYDKVAPSITKYTAVGLIVGVLLSVIALVIAAMLDDTIHDEEYVLRTYDYPILAKVPNLLNTGNKNYSYYYYRRKRKQKNEEGGEAK